MFGNIIIIMKIILHKILSFSKNLKNIKLGIKIKMNWLRKNWFKIKKIKWYEYIFFIIYKLYILIIKL